VQEYAYKAITSRGFEVLGTHCAERPSNEIVIDDVVVDS
jgi:hypothetical protein